MKEDLTCENCAKLWVFGDSSFALRKAEPPKVGAEGRAVWPRVEIDDSCWQHSANTPVAVELALRYLRGIS